MVDPLTIKLNLKQPFSPLLAQLTDRAGMMVSPKAAEAEGDKFGLHPVCAGPYKFVERVQQDRIVVEKFKDYWNKDNVFIDKITYLPIVDGTVRLANLRSGALDLIERVLATDIKTVRDDTKLKLAKAVSLGYAGLQLNLDNGPKANNPLAKNHKVREAFELSIDREALNQVVFNGEFVPGNQWVSPQNPYYQSKFPIPKRDVDKAKALLKEAGVTTPLHARLPGGERAGEPRRRRDGAGDGGRGRLRPQDPRHRVRDLDQGGRGRRLPALPVRLERPRRSRRQRLHHPGLQGAAQLQQILRSRGRRAAPGGAPHQRPGRPQGGVREDRRQGPARHRRRLPLSLAPAGADRPQRQGSRATSRCPTGWCA